MVYRRLSSHSFANLEGFGATSLKEELVERFPAICDAATFRYARFTLQHSLGGAAAIGDELQVAGCIDGITGMLRTNRPSQIFARIGAGEVIQPNMEDEQRALGEYQDRFQICKNLIENDLHWDSVDPKWVEKSSMARRHRFLTIKDLHWQWFNALVFGLVPKESGGLCPKETLARVVAIKDAALHYASHIGGWSDQIGLFVNVFGHNSVNCLFVHILDMANPGPSFKHLGYKNLSLDLVLQVLAEEISENSVPAWRPLASQQNGDPLSRRTSLADEELRPKTVISGTGGATSLKAEIVAKVPDLNNNCQLRFVRRMLIESLGGPLALFDELHRASLVDDLGQLTTEKQPFNLFARCASGSMEQPGMAEEQVALGSYQNRWMICRNRPENDENWDSEDPEWVGKASMSRRHRFLTTKDLHWQWFNALVFGIVPSHMGGVGLEEALAMVREMKAAALTYCANVGGWSDNIGLYFHVFGHNSVNSLHLHIVDLEETGPSFDKYMYKNMPLNVVAKVLIEEAVASRTQGATDAERTVVQPERTSAIFRSMDTVDSPQQKMTSFRSSLTSLEDAEEDPQQRLWRAEILELNVGGTRMATRRSTLLMAPQGSLLRSMFDGTCEQVEEPALDRDDRMFIDLPADSFQVILNRMRMRRLSADASLLQLSIDAELRQAIMFLGVQSLFPELNQRAAPPPLGCLSWCR